MESGAAVVVADGGPGTNIGNDCRPARGAQLNKIGTDHQEIYEPLDFRVVRLAGMIFS